MNTAGSAKRRVAILYGRMLEGPPRPPPPAELYEDDWGKFEAEDVYSTATPTAAAFARYTGASPEFFRLVVPPVWRQGNVTQWMPDCDLLRLMVSVTMDRLLKRYSAENLIAEAEPLQVPKMPVVEAAAEGLSAHHFAECDLIAVQHLYVSTVGLLDELQAHGLDPRGGTVIGKSYSTHFPAARALRERGYRVPSEPLEQHPLEAHDELMKKVLRGELERYAERMKRGEAKKKLLLLDEGGQLIDLVHREFPELLSRVVCVEQTTRGIRKVDALVSAGALRTPVVDVAREPLKLEYESPLIAASVMKEVSRKLTHLRQCGFEKGGVISLIGYGSLGKALARLAKAQGFRVRVFAPELSEQGARADGVERVASREAFFRGADILLSATGAAPMSLQDYRHLPSLAVLFNCASSNDELASRDAIAAARREQPERYWWKCDSEPQRRAAYLAELPELLLDREYVFPPTGWLWGEFGPNVIPLGNVARRERRDRVLHFPGKDLYLANSGFVTNLTDEADPIPARYIQLTRAALFAACAEAVSAAGEPGVRKLGEASRARILGRYLQPDAGGGEADWVSSWNDHLHIVEPTVTKEEGAEKCRHVDSAGSGTSEEGEAIDWNTAVGVSISPSHVLVNGVPY